VTSGDVAERTAVYRFFDAAGALLYVGLTNNTAIRWDHHARRKPWWRDVTRKSVTWFEDRPTAARAEAQAIRAESPKWNIVIPSDDGRRLSANYKTGRPATGQTRVMGFRPPREVRAAFGARAQELGRTPSDALVEAMHLWLDAHGQPETPPEPAGD
jgi:hypothetical protein